MKIALFSQSLFALPLDAAIEGTASLGVDAIELACVAPHFDLERARSNPRRVADAIRRVGLDVAALSLGNVFTDAKRWQAEVDAAATYVRLAPVFATQTVKLTPGPPASAAAEDAYWDRFFAALKRLVPLARESGVRLAVETHMRQLTDTLAGVRRLLQHAPADAVGLTVDYSNLAFAGEDMAEVLGVTTPRLFHAHIKNGHIDDAGDWHFTPLDIGWTDYGPILRALRRSSYAGYLSIECLGPDARERPLEVAQRDLAILRGWLADLDATEGCATEG